MRITHVIFLTAFIAGMIPAVVNAQTDDKNIRTAYPTKDGSDPVSFNFPKSDMTALNGLMFEMVSPKKRSRSREYPDAYLKKNLFKFQSMKSYGRNMIILGVPAIIGGAVLYADGMTHSIGHPYEEEGDEAKILGGIALMVVGEGMIIGGITLYAFGNKRVKVYRRLMKERGMEISAGLNSRGVCLTWHF